MKKNIQERGYAEVGWLLTQARLERKMSIAQLARKVGEQFNTIECIEKGNRFMAHQTWWIEDLIGMSVGEVFTAAQNHISGKPKGERNHGQQESNEESNQEKTLDLSAFI